MNVKQRAMGEKAIEHNHRYKRQNYDSTPSLMKGNHQFISNKENKANAQNFNGRSYQDKGQITTIKSTEFSKRLQTNQDDKEQRQFKKNKGIAYVEDLGCSHDFVRFRQKVITQPQQDNFFKGEHVTFGDVNRCGIVTSRDFIQEKKMKNDLIDQMIVNNKRGLCKSFNQFSLSYLSCTNHPTKKAKYRLIAQLSEGEQQMFYCSKCAINLLQQNFKIEEIQSKDSQIQCCSRIQQISKFESSLKNLEERIMKQMQKDFIRDNIENIQTEINLSSQKIDEMIHILESIKKQHLSKLNEIAAMKQNEQKGRKNDLEEMISSVRDIQQEIKQYKNDKKFSFLQENQFQFIVQTLEGNILKFNSNLQKIKPPSPFAKLNLPSINQQQILDTLRDQLIGNKVITRRQRQITFSRKSQPNSKNSDDDFICDQIKRPFRELFPSDQIEQNHDSLQYFSDKNRMLSSMRQKPNFGRI